MKEQVNILVFAGSLRRASFNKKLARAAAEMAREAGVEVDLIDLADYPMPILDQDLEAAEGPPPAAVRIQQKLLAADGLLIASPEYNGSLSGALKNTLDWVSRPSERVAPGAAFRGKVAGLLAASPGALGGQRGLVHLRAILSNLGLLVVPQQAAVSQAHHSFADDGRLVEESARKRVSGVVSAVIDLSRRLGDAA